MGNCTERYSERDKLRHLSKQSSKNDKKFICYSDDQNQLPLHIHYLPNLKALIKELSHEKHKFESKFENLSESTTDRSQCKRKLLIEVQKGLELCKPSCASRKKVMIRVDVSNYSRPLETEFVDFELPVWFQLFVVDEEIDEKYEIKFTAFVNRLGKKIKKVGDCSVQGLDLTNQKIFFKWINLENTKTKGIEPKILVKVQMIFDERLLFMDLMKETQEKIEKIQEFIDRNEKKIE